MKRMTILIEETAHRRLKAVATRRRTTMSDLVRDMIAFQIMNREDDPLFKNVPDDPREWRGGKRGAKRGDGFRG